MNSDMCHVNCDIILITDMSSDMCHVNCDIRLHNIMAIPKHFVWNKVGENNHPTDHPKATQKGVNYAGCDMKRK